MPLGLAFVLGLLVIATLLVLVDVWRELQRQQIRAAFRTRIRRELARDQLIHDQTAHAQASDYELLMAQRDGQQQHYHRLGGGVVTGRAVASAGSGVEAMAKRAYETAGDVAVAARKLLDRDWQ